MFLYVELLFLRKLSNFARSGPVELLLAVIFFLKYFGNTTLQHRVSIVIGRSVCAFLNVDYSDHLFLFPRYGQLQFAKKYFLNLRKFAGCRLPESRKLIVNSDFSTK